MILNASSLLPHFIIPPLIAIYGSVGEVGDSSISYRCKIARFLREIWTMKGYHEDITNIEENRVCIFSGRTKTPQSSIINFAHGLISIFSSLIAETFSSIPKIKAIYKEITTEAFMNSPSEQQDDKLLELKRMENNVKSSFLLANETLLLFKDAAEEWHVCGFGPLLIALQEVWMDDSIRNTLAGSLATILSQLVGKEGTDLKVWKGL